MKSEFAIHPNFEHVNFTGQQRKEDKDEFRGVIKEGLCTTCVVPGLSDTFSTTGVSSPGFGGKKARAEPLVFVMVGHRST